MNRTWKTGLAATALLLPAIPAMAQDAPPTLSVADTAFVTMCALFVMLMMVPGLALFYAGLGRAKNVLSVMTQVVATSAMVGVLWIIAGYSLTFAEGGFPAVIGGTSKLFLMGVGQESLVGELPEYLYVMFMLMFAAITPAIIIGGFAERVRFSAVLIFMAVWLFINYVPMAHMAWGGGWVLGMEPQDFAGGNVVHLNAGIAALVAALMIGPRKGYRVAMMAPHNMTMTTTGACMLWVGWLAFCGGCALAANGFSMLVMLNTFLGGAAGAMGWMVTEWIHRGRPSTLGILSGIIAGLVAITPACGFVSPMGAIVIGFIAAPPCVWAVEYLKHRFGYDDSFDVFGVHGVGAIVGGVLTVIFAADVLGGTGFPSGRDMGSQMVVQIGLILFSIVYSLISSYIALKVADVIVGLRATEDDEMVGLDISSHGESGYRLDDGQVGESIYGLAAKAHGPESALAMAPARPEPAGR
ncbi:MAG: ammonium transporter [Xanthobacter sp.]